MYQELFRVLRNSKKQKQIEITALVELNLLVSVEKQRKKKKRCS